APGFPAFVCRIDSSNQRMKYRSPRYTLQLALRLMVNLPVRGIAHLRPCSLLSQSAAGESPRSRTGPTSRPVWVQIYLARWGYDTSPGCGLTIFAVYIRGLRVNRSRYQR